MFISRRTVVAATSPDALNLAWELTDAGWQIPYSTRVDSITTSNTRAIGEDDLEVRALLEDPADISPDKIAYIEDTVLNELLLAGRLMSHDIAVYSRRHGVFVPAQGRCGSNQFDRHRSARLHEAAWAKYPDIRIELTGSQMLSNSFSEAAQSDLATLTPTSVLADCRGAYSDHTQIICHFCGHGGRHLISPSGHGFRRLAGHPHRRPLRAHQPLS